MSKRTHDGARSAAKVARRTGVLESLPTELIELFAVYSGAQACAALAQTCRWMAVFLSEPARQRRILEAHTTKKCIQCTGSCRWPPSWSAATITRYVLPSGYYHGVEEMHNQQGGALMRRRHWINGFLHGTSKYWKNDGTLRLICEWRCGQLVYYECNGKYGDWQRFVCKGRQNVELARNDKRKIILGPSFFATFPHENWDDRVFEEDQ